MNIVVAMLVADFLRAEILVGRKELLLLEAMSHCIGMQIVAFYARHGSTGFLNERDTSHIDVILTKMEAIRDQIEFIKENDATLATLEVAIQHDNVEYLAHVCVEGKK
jgi:predicted RNA binding protein with dsRBD fold (UPF0201 family)